MTNNEGRAPRPQLRGFFWPLLIAAALVANAYLAVRAMRAEQRVRELSRELFSAEQEGRRMRSRHLAYQRALAGVELRASGLGGVDVARNERVTMTGTRDGVYYVLDPQCGACAGNLPFLESLAAQAPGRVRGLAPYDSVEVARYAEVHKIAFPVLVRPSGQLVNIVPRHATPLTLLVTDGRVTSVFEGQLDDAAQVVIATAQGITSAE